MDSGRKSPRRDIATPGMVYNADGQAFLACMVRNVSASGGNLELSKDIPLPKFFTLALTPDGNVRRLCKPVWQLSTVVGVRFTTKPDD